MPDINKVLEYSNKLTDSKKGKAQKVLELSGYEFNNDGDIVVDLNLHNKNLGKITYNAYKAIEDNKLDSYKPKNDEKKVIEDYKALTAYDKTPIVLLQQYDSDKYKYGQGNIDLSNRPIYKNPDGAISTVDSISINEDGKEIVIPTIVKDENGNAKKLTDDEAIKHYHSTGEYLGKFDSVDEAERYAIKLHFEQAKYYTPVPLVIEIDGETKNFGNISHNAYYALSNNKIDGYTPKNEEEKTAIESYKKFLEDYAKKQREPKDFWEGLVNGIGYTAENIGAGFANGLESTGKFVVAGIGNALYNFNKDEEGWRKDLASFGKNIAEETLNEKMGGELWKESLESRYRVPDWYRDYAGGTTYAIGGLLPGIIAEYYTATTSPLLETQLASFATNSATRASTATSIASKLIRPSDVYLGLSAGGSAATSAYRQTGNLDNSISYGTLNGLGEIFTERLFGGIGGTDFGADELIDVSKIKGLRKIASTKYGEKVLDIVFEGVEEVIMTDFEPWFQKATINPDAEINHLFQSKFWKDRGEAFAQGMLLSSIMNASTATFNKVNQKIGKNKLIKTLNEDAVKLNESLPDGVTKFEPLKKSAKMEEVESRYTDIQRVKAINELNGVTEGINALFKSDASKFEPLKYDSTIEEIQQRQKEIVTFGVGYADIMVDELVKNNPEQFTDIEKTEIGDTYIDAKTGNVLTVVNRDDKKTTVEIHTDEKTASRDFANEQADKFATTEQLVYVGNEYDKEVVEDYESEADELMATDMSEDETTVEEAIEEATTPTAETKPSNAKDVTLTRVGEFYVAYGDTALELSKKLELTPRTVNKNGVETTMVGFPIRYLDAYSKKLGKGYNITTVDSKGEPISEAKNKPTTKENTTTNKETLADEIDTSDAVVSEVVDAIEETLEPGAKESIFKAMERKGYKGDLVTFAKGLRKSYKQSGTLGAFADYFTDGGAKVVSAIEETLNNGATISEKETIVAKNETTENVAVAENTTTTEKENTTVTEEVLKNQSQSDTINADNVKNTPATKQGNTTAYTNDNQKIDLLFKVVSVDDLIVSNSLDGKVNPNYPQELQPRDRSRVSSQSQIRQMANTLNPARLEESTSVADGSPIVGSDNVVESGNGRTLAIELAYKMGTADEYINYIINNAEKFDIDVSNLPENPVLVRERLTEVDRVEFTRKANESSISSLSATEQARVDAENLTEDVLNLLVSNDEGIINTADNQDFISAVISKVFKNEDLNNVVGAEGRLSARGLERITNAIFYKAYGDISLSVRLSESLDNDMKNATKVLLNVAPKVVVIKNGIVSEQYYNFNFAEDIASAVRLFEQCRNKNETVLDYANQTSFLEKQSPLVMAMAYVFETKNRGAKQATDFYNLLLDTVIEMGNPLQVSMGTFEVFQSKEEILNATLEKFNNRVEPKNTITIPESVFRLESTKGRDYDSRRVQTVPGDNTSTIQEESVGTRIQQDNGQSEETRTVSDDKGIRETDSRRKTEQSEVTEVEQPKVEKTSYDVAFFKNLSADINKGENISLEDVKTAVDALLLNNGESIKAELSQLKNDELKKQLSIFDRGRITKKAEMVDAIYSDLISSLYYAVSGKDTISYVYDGSGFNAQQTKMLLDVLNGLTEESFRKHLADNAEKYKKHLAERKEKLAKVKNPQTLEEFAYKKRYFGLSDEETIQFENLYAQDRKKAREDKKSTKATKDTSGVETFFSNADNYTIEKTTHTKTGEDVWVVRTASRLETEEWKQLNEQMKALGGSYWRGNQGWNFSKNPTSILASNKDSETETAKGSTTAEKLRNVADSMQKAIDDKFKDRLTNTAKRAREAASAEAEGERLKRLQDTINNIAEILENGENTLLDKIDSKAQVETLMNMLRTSRRNRISETLSDASYEERTKEQDKPYSNDDAKYAEYPLSKLHENIVSGYLRTAEGKTGYKQISDRLKKAIKNAKNGYVTVDKQMFSDIDKIVKNLSPFYEQLWNDGVAERKRLARMGIENVVELRAYLREFINYLPGENAEAERQRTIKAKERQLANSKIEGFFPTPKAIVEQMLDEANIQPGETVLEPSAGKGNIADEIKAKYPDNSLDVVEWNSSLNELLSEKGHNVVGEDFLKTSTNYDKIIMNPPFEKGQDIDHIRHAYSLLNEGGRVVCIMSEGPFYRSDKKATEFREWLDEVGGVSEKLPDGSFKNSERSTGVNTRLVVIDKTTSTPDDGNRYSVASEDSYAPTFYSQMGKTIDEMKQDKIGAKDVVNYLKGKGVKAEEIKWSGIETFLEGRKSVTKAELQEFVAGSQLQIEETVLDGSQAVTIENQRANPNDVYVMRGGKLHDSLTWNETDKVWVSDNLGYSFSSEDSIRNYYGVGEGGTRWGDYKLDGGENYREITFNMPNSDFSNRAMKTHWGENAEGILAHARIQDFDVNGKKMLFIEEIQSDWHNEGAKRGYAKSNDVDIRAKRQELENYIKSRLGKENSAEEIAKLQEARAEYIRLGQNMSNADAVPDAPFRNNYHEYVLKSLIRMAAENGYDSIGWTPADVQSDRWSTDYAEGYRIEYDQDIPKFLNKYGKKWGAKVGRDWLTLNEDLDEQNVWSMDITESMKNSVLYEGQTLYSVEREGNENEQIRSDSLLGNSRRGYNGSTRKQTERISYFKQKNQGRNATERQSFAKELLEQGQTEEKIEKTNKQSYKYQLVKPEAYNDDMIAMVEEAKSKGVELGFFVGNAKVNFDTKGEFRVDGIKFSDKRILVQYDADRLPQILAKHELGHAKWNTPEWQAIKNKILDNLSEADKKKILSQQRYKRYMEIYKGNKDLVWEEFVCDVMSGMNEYTDKYIDTVTDYWYGGEIVDSFKVSEYTESIDAGGTNKNALNNTGREGNLSITSDDYTERALPEGSMINEYHKDLSSYEWWKYYQQVNNYDWDAELRKSTFDFYTVVGDKLIKSKYSKGKPTVMKIYTVNALEILPYEEGIIYDNDTKEILDELTKTTESLHKGTDDNFRLSIEGQGKNNGKVVNVDGKQLDTTTNYELPEQGSSTIDDERFSLEGDDIPDFLELWEEYVAEYGAIPKGEKPVRDVDVPKKISEKDVVSHFARTMIEAGVTPDWAISEFEKAIVNGEMTHEVITNKKAQDWATKQIKYHGFEDALNQWSGYCETGEVGKKELALGMELYNQCINNKDVHNAMKIAAELAAEATRAGQTLQACRMLKLMTPDGQLYYLEKSVQKMNEEFKDKLGEKFKDIKLDENLMEDFINETDDSKRNELYDKICQHIADQIPATLSDKWNSWRYLAMLGNPRTHMRNILGNAVFIPSVRIKNYVGAVIEKIAKVDTAERTKSLYKSEEAIDFATNDFAEVEKLLQGENAKYATTGDIEGKRTIFQTDWLEKARLKNFEFLEKEDIWFLKMHYVDTLARLITVRNIDTKSIDKKTLDKMRAIAIKEAQAATYRDSNSLAEGLIILQRKLGRSKNKALKYTGVLIEGVMPFKKTPLNIAKQGLNYSPIGILKGTLKAFTKLKDGSATTAAVIDDFAKGLTGTGMLLLGFFLAKMGILVGAGDKPNKEKEFDKMVGEQDYSINIGDWSYTIDWATPSNLSLFIGAELYNLTKDEFKFADVVSAVSTITEPLLELSVFNGVNGVIESAQYSEGSPLLAIGFDMATSYFMQALPTIGGQLSRMIDGNKREYYYVDKNKDIPKGMQRILGQASSKIPFASRLFEVAIDEWGREESYGNLLERGLENTVSPGYYAKENYTDVDRVLKDLYEKTGETSVLPITQQKYYEENYIRYDMTAEEYTEAKKMRGQKSFEYVSELLANKKSVKLKDEKTGKYKTVRYSQMSDTEKVKAIKKCYEQAGDETKETMLEKMKKRKESK